MIIKKGSSNKAATFYDVTQFQSAAYWIQMLTKTRTYNQVTKDKWKVYSTLCCDSYERMECSTNKIVLDS